MILAILVGMAITWWFGWCVIRYWWPASLTAVSSLALRHCLSFGIGAGAASCAMFVWLLIHGRLDRSLPLLEIVTAILLLIVVVKRKGTGRPAPMTRRIPFSRRETIWAIVFGMALLTVLVSHIQMAAKSPHGGGFDSFATWNLRARFLFRGGTDWPLGFSNILAWSHPDYPLLVPATVARLWCYAGWDAVFAPGLLATSFTLATIALLTSGVSWLCGREQGMLAGIALMSTPFFVTHGASQFADTPLSFFILATMLLVALHVKSLPHKAEPGLLVCAGATAGFAAWTKNEGMVFAGIATAVLLLPLLRKHGPNAAIRQLSPFFRGLIPVMICVALFKLSIAPPNDLMAGQNAASSWQRLIDPSRYWKVFCWFAERIFLFDNKGFVHVVPVLAAYLLIVGVKTNSDNQSAVKQCARMLVLMIGAFAMVYICTPADLEWHLKTSLDRLILQLWPSVLLIYFLSIRTPSDLAAGPHSTPELSGIATPAQ